MYINLIVRNYLINNGSFYLMPRILNLFCCHCSHTAIHGVSFNTITPNAIVYLLLLVQSIFFISNSVILYLIHYSFNYSVDFKPSFSNSSIPNGIAHFLFHFLLNWSSQNLQTIFLYMYDVYNAILSLKYFSCLANQWIWT